MAGRVKTRLTPPFTPEQATRGSPRCRARRHAGPRGPARPAGDARRVLVLEGAAGTWVPAGFDVLPQRGDGLAERLAAAFEDVGEPGLPGRHGHAAGHARAARRRAGRARPRRRRVRPGARRRLLGDRPPPAGRRGVPRRADERAEHRGRAARAARGARAHHRRAARAVDVDTTADARAVAAAAPRTRFAARWRVAHDRPRPRSRRLSAACSRPRARHVLGGGVPPGAPACALRGTGRWSRWRSTAGSRRRCPPTRRYSSSPPSRCSTSAAGPAGTRRACATARSRSASTSPRRGPPCARPRRDRDPRSRLRCRAAAGRWRRRCCWTATSASAARPRRCCGARAAAGARRRRARGARAARNADARTRVRIEAGGEVSEWFGWARVGVDGIEPRRARAGLPPREVLERGRPLVRAAAEP